jgi:hypothetical protein
MEDGMPTPLQIRKIKSVLFQSTEYRYSYKTYAVLDAARDKVIHPKILNLQKDWLCLYHGSKATELALVAPYLIQLEREAPFTDWIINQGWGKSWGIFLKSNEPLERVQRHLRKFLMVYSEEGEPLYFRYYDPRVFRAYLPTCNETELKLIFGPITSFFAEGQTDSLIEYSRTPEFKLLSNEIGLTQTER